MGTTKETSDSKEQIKADRDAVFQRITKKEWCDMAGRQRNVMDRLAREYGFPLLGPTVSLPAFLAFFHEFMVKNREKLQAEPEEEQEESEMLERLRKERWRIARLDRQAKEGDLLPKAVIHEVLAKLSSTLRGTGEILQRQCGDEAAGILNAALMSFDSQLDEVFGEEVQ